MGPIRQSLAVATIGAVKPESKEAAEHRMALAALEPQLASSSWPPGPSKGRGACEPE
jgi:hypothetical protein